MSDARKALGLAILSMAERPLASAGVGHERPKRRRKRSRRMRELANRERQKLRQQAVAEAGRHDRWTRPPKLVIHGPRMPRSMRTDAPRVDVCELLEGDRG